jgi:hypothetical protein
MHPAPGFASLSRCDLQLLLNRPGAGGAGQSMPDGQTSEPCGWNRIQLEVGDLTATVEKLRGAGGRFRNEIVIGNGGKQILVEDPSGNPVELFEAAEAEERAQARLCRVGVSAAQRTRGPQPPAFAVVLQARGPSSRRVRGCTDAACSMAGLLGNCSAAAMAPRSAPVSGGRHSCPLRPRRRGMPGGGR